jgi:hypothetical protein
MGQERWVGMVRRQKPLKRFSISSSTVITWLKPGADEIPNPHSKKQVIVSSQIMACERLVLRHAGIHFIRPGRDAACQVD